MAFHDLPFHRGRGRGFFRSTDESGVALFGADVVVRRKLHVEQLRFNAIGGRKFPVEARNVEHISLGRGVCRIAGQGEPHVFHKPRGRIQTGGSELSALLSVFSVAAGIGIATTLAALQKPLKADIGHAPAHNHGPFGPILDAVFGGRGLFLAEFCVVVVGAAAQKERGPTQHSQEAPRFRYREHDRHAATLCFFP